MIIPTEIPFLVSFDPGGIHKHTTGAGEWSDRGEFTYVSQMNQVELDEYLISLESRIPKFFIVEDYRLIKSRNKGGSRLETIKIVGQLEAFARRYKVTVKLQSPNILQTTAMWAGVKWPIKNHAQSHWVSAYLHGYYYLHQAGIIPPRVLENN